MSDKTQTTPLVQPAPPIVGELVRRFGEHIDAYKSGRYNETQLRREFIDPLFKALGWDVDNERGYAEAYKDVIHEAAVQIEGAVKAPDYSFRIGGVRKFFLEAKKPSINIKGDPGPAYQLRRYAWSAKLPLSILTDFEEFAVYDCRVRPVKTDSPATARVLYLKYTDYLARWGEIASIFSREAILTGSFDKYVESKKRKRGTAEVDAAFLQEIEAWRETLARNLALRNAALTQRQLNFAVQVTVDRIIFLRMCEDRGIEDYARLMALLNGDRVYDRLMQVFREADQRYNSGLFHFQREPGRADPDELTPDLAIDDRVLKDIIKGLYYPDSPYEFSVLPADILGHVYEQFLGKVIRLTSGHRAKVEEKPEVRKAGGVYYTPTYIVQYIVKHTVGKLLEDRSIKWIGREKKRAVNQPRLDKPLRVLDPACGSGSFLLGAYQYLLDWYLDYYTTHDPEKWARKRNPPIYQSPSPPGRGVRGKGNSNRNYRLTVAERKRILVDHIYGVDIDTQAVEVTKLSLLLKVLEGETTHSLGTHLWYEKERALPDLASNIKCGNSLIGPDFYEGKQLAMFGEDELLHINAFDWAAEFADVFSRSPRERRQGEDSSAGFNAVIGNPPWGQKGISTDDESKKYLRDKYTSLAGIFDLFRPFVERGIGLTSPSGMFGMVLPDIVLLKDYPATRLDMLDNLAISRIDWWGMPFEAAVIDAATIIGQMTSAGKDHLVLTRVHEDSDSILPTEIPQRDFRENPRYIFNLYMTPQRRRLLAHLESYPKLSEVFEAHEGVHSGNIRSELFVDDRIDETCHPLIFGRGEVARYRVEWAGKFIRLSALPERKTRDRYANIGQRAWHECRKVLVRRTGDYVLAAVDDIGRFCSNNFFLIIPKTESALALSGLCAILNSRFTTWLFRMMEPRKGRVFAELKIKHLNVFPLPDLSECGLINSLGDERHELEQRLHKTESPQARTTLSRLSRELDSRIDSAVLQVLDVPKEFYNEIMSDQKE